MKVLIFKAKFFYKKRIFRKIEVLENINLYSLAAAILASFDFYFDHCFGFFSNVNENYFKSEKQYELFTDLPDAEPTGAGSVKKTKAKDVWQEAGDKMLFLFDYGDNWLFEVELIGFNEKNNSEKYPKIIEAKGESPEQYPDYDDVED